MTSLHVTPQSPRDMDSVEQTTTSTSCTTVSDHRLRREICTTGCGRPSSVCICLALPLTPLRTSTKVVILHHPQERRHKLATVPVLARCLSNCEVIVGRKLTYGQLSTLDDLYDRACGNTDLTRSRALYLFPGSDALALAGDNRFNPSVDGNRLSDVVLMVFDGTWKHAKEMVRASLPFISKFAIKVCLDFDPETDGGTKFNSELIIRKEPFAGCMSTMEAVARSLGILELNGIDIELKLIQVLRAMVGFQASYLKPSPRQENSNKSSRRE